MRFSDFQDLLKKSEQIGITRISWHRPVAVVWDSKITAYALNGSEWHWQSFEEAQADILADDWEVNT